MASDGAELCVFADWHQQALSQVLSRATAQQERDVMHDLLQPSAAPSPRLDDVRSKPFGENPARTIVAITAKTPDLQADPDRSPVCRKITQAPLISAMDLR